MPCTREPCGLSRKRCWAKLAKRMRDSDIGAIPVRADGHLVGIITDRDLACRAVADGGDLSKMTAQDVMKHVAYCSREDDIGGAIQVMKERRSGACPSLTVTTLSLACLASATSPIRSTKINPARSYAQCPNTATFNGQSKTMSKERMKRRDSARDVDGVLNENRADRTSY